MKTQITISTTFGGKGQYAKSDRASAYSIGVRLEKDNKVYFFKPVEIINIQMDNSILTVAGFCKMLHIPY